MNRAIKFRAWSAKASRMYFDVDVLHGGVAAKDGHYLFYAEHDALMQFTGIKDKLEREIYEGDIVSSAPGDSCYTGVVKFGVTILTHDEISIATIGFYVDTPVEALRAFVTDELSRGEVLVMGNLYENPELLQEQPA